MEINGGIIVHDSKNNRDHKITSISFDGNNTLSSANESRDGITWETEDLASHPLRPLRLPLLLATKERRSNNKHCGRERGSPLSLILREVRLS